MPDKPKKLLLLGSQMETGGAQRLLLQQGDWFQSRGWEVTAAFLYDKEGLYDRWQTEHSFRLFNLRARESGAGMFRRTVLMVSAVFRLYRLMQVQRFDAILTFTHHSNLIGIPLAWWAGVRVRAASHHGHILDFPKWLEKLHARLVNSWMTGHFIVVSDPIRLEAVEEGIRPEKITVIENGISLPDQAQVDAAPTRQELMLGEQTKLVITVGRMTDQKAQTYLIRAIPAVIQQFPDTVFAFVGDGPLADELAEEALRLDIADRVRFLGIRRDVLTIMAAADIFVLPSIFEGLPVAMLEAMGMGSAVIATPVGGVPQVIRHGETGLVIPMKDAEAISRAIISLLADDAERNRLAKNGQKLVRREFTMDKMCAKYESIFLAASRRSEFS